MTEKPLFTPQTEWLPPIIFPDLRDRKEIAIDLETKDPFLKIPWFRFYCRTWLCDWNRGSDRRLGWLLSNRS